MIDRLAGDKPEMKQQFGAANQFRYPTSKRCTLLHMYELNRRSRDISSSVIVTTSDPGLMPGTGLGPANHGAGL